MDQQGTAEKWAEWRNDEPPAVIAAKAATLGCRLEQARAGGGDLVIIDTPPQAQGEAREAATVADLILIPCRPSAFDLDAIKQTARMAKDSGKPAYVVVNAGPHSGTVIFDDVSAVVKTFGLEIAPHRLTDRAAFRRSARQGRAVMETEPDGKAAEEVGNLYRWLTGVLGIARPTKRKRSAA